MDRRPIKSRDTSWARYIAQRLAATGITPNQISVASVFFSLLTAIFFYAGTAITPYFYLLGSLGIVMRLLCNLFDGMVAVEYAKATGSGGIYNDAPDRFADLLIIVGAGHAAISFPHALYIAWIAASFAIMTAYARVLGAANGTEHFFMGPMAKQHRMFLLILGGILEWINGYVHFVAPGYIFYYVIILIALGSIATTLRRLIHIIFTLEKDNE